jgi:integrase
MSRDVTPHTLRHSFASLEADLGLPDNTIAGLLGHARSSITSRYIHLDKALIAAADQVAGETMRLMQAT